MAAMMGLPIDGKYVRASEGGTHRRVPGVRAEIDSAGAGPFAACDVAQHVQVGTRTEPAPFARQNDDDDLGILLGRSHRVLDLALHALRPRVELLGAIQRDDRNGIVDFVFDLLVHGVSGKPGGLRS